MSLEFRVLRVYSDNYTSRSADEYAVFYKEDDAFFWAKYQNKKYSKSKYRFILESDGIRYPVKDLPETYKKFKELKMR